MLTNKSLDKIVRHVIMIVEVHNMKKLITLLLLLNLLPVQATTVHRWELELSNACSQYVSVNYTKYDFYNCMVQNTRDYFIWRHGWETPVEGKVLGILTMYDPALVKATASQKVQLSDDYRWSTYAMYSEKMSQRKDLNQYFTQADVDRIWSAR